MDPSRDVAAVRLDNTLRLFDEFVQQTVRQPDAATLRGLERRFAERLQIQPSYWSQIKGRSRQIGERLARQFEQCCGKPAGWLDQPVTRPAAATQAPAMDTTPRDEDERFIVGLVLTYYRRHPQRARTRLLDLLGEVLVPAAVPPSAPAPAPAPAPPSPARSAPAAQAASATEDPQSLWLSSQTGTAPLRRRR